MNLRNQAKDTLDDVTEASRRVVETTEWAAVALIAVAAVSLFALGIGTAAYIRAGHQGCTHAS